MNHYCTYFDAGFLAQGMALWNSLHAYDAQAVLWVLALDDGTEKKIRELAEPDLRVIPLSMLERDDAELLRAKANRSRVEYYFTLSPCFPRWLLKVEEEIDALVYLDADLFFFSSPQPIWDELARGSVLLCAHDFPAFLYHYEKHGHYNVGVLGWRRDPGGLACLDWWRERCLEWCYDRLELGRYADQKYLEEWPGRFAGVVTCAHPGINFAPWNWMNRTWAVAGGKVFFEGTPLVVFHFARFRALAGNWLWQSGQLDYGVMPARLRNGIYGPYWRALKTVGEATASSRLGRGFWRSLPLRFLFGSDWVRVGDRFISGRFGLGRYSGRFLAKLRTIFLRR
ncbi:glycosyl transferase [Oleiharenicola lentus]|uniref:glycosyl transferase n=1 Tax=Oleiharenicola lentus TaxID=2508720 RepID=UPI003F6658B8